MVVVLPAGARIPALPPLKVSTPRAGVITDENSQDFLRDAVSGFVGTLDVYSACSVTLYALNIQSVLPPHLKQRPTPRELGAVKFSLDLGVLGEKYHTFIDPGPLPRGFMHEAQYHAETHRIPVCDFEEGTTDYKTVYDDVIAYLESTNIVFTHSNLVQYTQEALDWIANNSGSKPRCRLLVLPLETLAQELILLASGEISYTVRLVDELRPQILEHVTHIGCSYHAPRDIPVCALSTSHRQAVATHGLLQKYFWEHLTKLETSSGPASHVNYHEESLLQSFNRASITVPRSPTRTYTDQSRDNVKTTSQSRDSVESTSQSRDSVESTSQSEDRSWSCDRDGMENVSPMFTLPDIFQNRTLNEANDLTEQRADNSREDHRLTDSDNSGYEHLRRPRYSAAPIVNTCQNKQTNQADMSRSPLTQFSLTPSASSPGNLPPRRPGLGRGFLGREANKTPPRRPNS